MSEQLIPTPGNFGENDNFLLERELGAGGMGSVYMGRDKMLDRPVAVKVMLREYGEDAEFVENFKKEAQAAAKLIHPNIAQVYSYGICDGMPYVAMELASGGSLFSIMKATPGHTDVTRVMKICQQTAQALQCANDQGFVHGDIKPENILLDANGNAKLVDFGLAAMQKNTSEIWGTPYYISPEKVKKEVIDFRADMYSLGATLYHALTGVAPFEGEDSIAVVKKRFEGNPKKPSDIRPDITPAVDALVMKMLALNKEERYPSFEALLEAFREVLSKGLSADAEKGAQAAAKPAASRPGSRRMVVRTRRTMTVHGAAGNHSTGPAGAAVGDIPPLPPVTDDEEDEEEGGSLGLKVLLFVVGGLLLIGGVIGGLIWFKVHSKAVEEQAIVEQIQTGCRKANDAIADTVQKAKAYADEFDQFVLKAVEECQKPTDELIKLLPVEQAKLLKPAVTKELLDAIASTNEAKVVAPPPAPAAANKAASATNAVAKAAATNVPAAKADEKAVQVANQAAEQAEPPCQAVVNMNELWKRAYSCQACAVKVRHQTTLLVRKAAEADALKEMTRANMDKLAELSRVLVEMFEAIKGSKEVENVRKDMTYIKSKGANTVKQTEASIRRQKIDEERKRIEAQKKKEELERLRKLEEEKKAKIEEEKSAVTTLFATIVEQGTFRQFDWKSAIRQLDSLKGDLKTAEGQLQADAEIRKVECMQKMHEVFVKSIVGHKFKLKGKLYGNVVSAVTGREITLTRADGKTKFKVTWQKFVKEYPGNLNELINRFIIKGRTNAKPALNLKNWAEAMAGAALTMQLVCSDVNGAVENSEKIAKMIVKDYPDYAKIAQNIFPNIKFEVSEEE